MIKQLQKKFVFMSMLAISILLVVVLGGINIFNTVSANKQTDKLLSTLAQVENSAITMMLPEVRSSWDFFSIVVTQDDTLGAIYFVVRDDSFGRIRSIDTSHISSVSVEEAQYYTRLVQLENENSGKIGRFKYLAMPTVGSFGKTYIFLDVRNQMSDVWQVAGLSVLVGILWWSAMLLFVILLSKRAIRPIASNIEKQKHFVTDAGHEIKTPLVIIMANMDAMELRYGENKYSKNIRNQTYRLKDLTKELLSLAKMEESAIKPVKEWFSFTDLLNESIGQFSEGMREKNITLNSEICPDLNLKSDRRQMEKLISILLDNATKYTSVQGEIGIFLSKAGKYAVLTVANTADDLQKLQPDKLFDRFYCGDDARTRENGGYGIGLSAALAIVESVKGFISAQIEKNERIIFTVKLPME